MHLIRCDATASYQTTTMTFQTNLNLTTVVHYDIYLENCAAPVQPPKINNFHTSRSKLRCKHFQIL